jgi:hypothetical protein
MEGLLDANQTDLVADRIEDLVGPRKGGGVGLGRPAPHGGTPGLENHDGFVPDHLTGHIEKPPPGLVSLHVEAHARRLVIRRQVLEILLRSQDGLVVRC